MKKALSRITNLFSLDCPFFFLSLYYRAYFLGDVTFWIPVRFRYILFITIKKPTLWHPPNYLPASV